MQQNPKTQGPTTTLAVVPTKTKRRSRNEWHRRRRLLIAQGRWNPTEHRNPEPAREHLNSLRDTYGVSCDALSDLSGIPTRTIFELLDETRPDKIRKWVTPALEQRVLATEFDLDVLADLRRLNAIGTHRRIRALMRLGWNLERLGNQLGVTTNAVSGILAQPQVTASTARRIAYLYDELAMTPGPSTRGATLAARAGYPPPLAWDEGTIDDPAAHPHPDTDTNPDTAGNDVDEIAIERALAGEAITLTPDEADIAARRAVERGVSDAEVAKMTGACPRTILRWRQSAGIESRYAERYLGKAS